MPSVEDQATATGNMHEKLSRAEFDGAVCELCKQTGTNKQTTDILITILYTPPGGKVIKTVIMPAYCNDIPKSPRNKL